MTATARSLQLAGLRRIWGEAYRITWDNGRFRATHITSGHALDAQSATGLRKLLRDHRSHRAAWPGAGDPGSAEQPAHGRLPMDPNTGTEPDGRASQPLPAAMTAAPNGLCWRREFPGEERRLSEVRAWLASLLPTCAARDDVLSIATELGANAVRHTASGHGGSFTIEITWTPRLVRVAVADGGGLTEPQVTEDPLSEHGRGLLMVRGLAQRTGVDGDQHGRRIWAEVAWDGPTPTPPAPATVPVPGDGAVSDERPMKDASRLTTLRPPAAA